MRRPLLLGIVAVTVAACATAPPPPAPGPSSEPPPQGSRRLPSSINCEAQPPCAEDCVTATGEKARRLGSLDKEDIRQVIRAQVSQMQDCYDAIGALNPDAAGKVTVRFGIAPSGAVETSCLVSSELGDPSADRCIIDRPLAWKFPKPEGGGWVVVTYPFVFTR
jgi:hypothetical protein